MQQAGCNIKSQKGQTVIVAVIVASLLMLTVTLSIARVALDTYIVSDLRVDSVNAYFLAESGAEDSLRRLKDDLYYQGGTYTTPIGGYVTDVDRVGNVYTINSSSTLGNITRKIRVVATLEMISDDVTKFAVFGGDNVIAYSPTSLIRGDTHSNDDVTITLGAVSEGDMYSAGEGGYYTTWVSLGGLITDNPNTTDKVEGTIKSVNKVIVLDATVEGDVYSEHSITVLGGTIGGDQYPNAPIGLTVPSVPVFDFETYKAQAQAAGTYFANQNAFTTFVDSCDNGTTRALPDGVYYVETGNATIFNTGNPVTLNGSIISKGVITFYCGATLNSLNNLPVIATRKDVQFWDSGPPRYIGDTVTINGVIYSERDVILDHVTVNKPITVTGAIWGGDIMWVGNHATVIYDPAVINTEGFGFVTEIGDITISDWEEIL